MNIESSPSHQQEDAVVPEQKIAVVIPDGPIGNLIWTIEGIVIPLLSNGYRVQMPLPERLRGMLPQRVELLDEVNSGIIDNADHVFLRVRETKNVPQGRGVVPGYCPAVIPKEKLCPIPYNEGWAGGDYQEWQDVDISAVTKSRQIIGSYHDLVREVLKTPDQIFPASAGEWLFERLDFEGVETALKKIYGTGENRISPERPLIGIFVATGAQSKNYPLDKWEELSVLILECSKKSFPGGVTICFFGGPEDPEPPSSLRARYPGCVTSRVGALNFPEMYLALRMCSLVIAGDTQAGHAAAALNVPSLTLFGRSTIPELVSPYGDMAHVLVADASTPAPIVPQEAAAEAMRMLELYGLNQRVAMFYGDLQNEK